MASTFKTTFMIELLQQRGDITGDEAKVGWTETWYQNALNLQAALDFATEVALPSYAYFRSRCLSQYARLTWVRVSDEFGPRIFKSASIPNAGPQNLTVTPPSFDVALLTDLTALPAGAGDSSHHRRFLIRGLSNRLLVSGNVLGTAAGGTWARLKAFLDYIGGHAEGSVGEASKSGWLIKGLLKPLAAEAIQNLVIDPLNPRQLILTADLGARVIGDRVIIRQCNSIIGANRTWTVMNNSGSPGPYKLAMQRKTNALCGTWANDGIAIVPIYVYLPANEYVPIGVRNKRTGRPPKLLRGRRSVALLR